MLYRFYRTSLLSFFTMGSDLYSWAFLEIQSKFSRKGGSFIFWRNSRAALIILVWPGHESWRKSHVNSRLSTLACQLSLVQLSCNSCSRLSRTWELTKVSCLQTLACQLSCNSCSRLTKTWKFMELSCKLSHIKYPLPFSSLINT